MRLKLFAFKKKTYSTGRGAHENVLVGLVSHWVNDGLDTVEGSVGFEGRTAHGVHLGQGDDLFSSTARRLFGNWDSDLFVILKPKAQ